MIRHGLAAMLIAAATSLMLSQAAFAAEDGITVVESEKFGPYIADSAGKPLYLFTSDKQGAGYATPSSVCKDDCATAWPPFMVGKSPAPGDGVKAHLVGTMNRSGKSQATYNGWPLYYFIKDEGKDAPQGQDKHGFGGEWYLLTPDGEKVHEGDED
ncbi:hypothetical protein V6C03_05060 [Methyloligella sp. 2.7D]|uniref:COG4315 family predicted lipoprotein n=1 Tax=unclassified Methyloligella TaxID=2625955 RepID=UPI00157D4B5A|nr:hypothetical protein [Methyloligella sp. GL2]QKP76042.1 hypothetical protein HT051_00365 [Methyloligella sp. GL2]